MLQPAASIWNFAYLYPKMNKIAHNQLVKIYVGVNISAISLYLILIERTGQS